MIKYLIMVVFLQHILYGCGCHDETAADGFKVSVESAVVATDEAAGVAVEAMNQMFNFSAEASKIDMKNYETLLLLNRENNVKLQSIIDNMRKQVLLKKK